MYSFQISPQRVVAGADIVTKMIQHRISDHHHTHLFRGRINLENMKNYWFFAASFDRYWLHSTSELLTEYFDESKDSIPLRYGLRICFQLKLFKWKMFSINTKCLLAKSPMKFNWKLQSKKTCFCLR